uniref:Uncharacterized protein n=1 Tax=Anas zonorhyncha TaxID=75864 RepID=A0A8B9V131_9AVES
TKDPATPSSHYFAEIETFDKTKLKKTETREKNPLPTKEKKPIIIPTKGNFP